MKKLPIIIGYAFLGWGVVATIFFSALFIYKGIQATIGV